jgi:hypothetical protein
MTTPTSWLSIEPGDSGALADDALGGHVIDPCDYAAAIAQALSTQISAVSVIGEKNVRLYEVWVNGRILVRLPKDEAVAFLDGLIAGVNLTRGRDDDSRSATD